MNDVTFALNPKVREIFEAAVKAAQPVWLGVTCDGVEMIERCQIYFEPSDVPEMYFNANQINYLTDTSFTANGAVLAKTKASVPFIDGPLDHERRLRPLDTLIFQVASITVWGPVTKELCGS